MSRDALSDPEVVGSVGDMPRSTSPAATRPKLLTYTDISRMTGRPEGTLNNEQWRARRREAEGLPPLSTDMPAPVGEVPNRAGLPQPRPLFDERQIREWLMFKRWPINDP